MVKAGKSKSCLPDFGFAYGSHWNAGMQWGNYAGKEG